MTERKNKAKLFSFKYLFVDFVRLTAAVPTLLWYRPKVLYENENAKKKIKGRALVISNHTFFFDPIYLMLAIWYRRHRFICNQKFYETNAKFFFKLVRCIPIDIENFNIGSLRVINDCLQSGELVSMFPEGHINDGTDNMRSFKSGMVLMAMRAGAPIVPIYVKRHRPVYKRLTIMIGEAIDINARYGGRMNLSQIDELTTELFDKENKLKAMIDERQ